MRYWEGGESQDVGQGALQHIGRLGEVLSELGQYCGRVAN